MKKTRRPAWEIKLVTFTGNHSYPFHVIGVNHYELEKGERGTISWSVPSITDNEAYDLSGATFYGAACLVAKEKARLAKFS